MPSLCTRRPTFALALLATALLNACVTTPTSEPQQTSEGQPEQIKPVATELPKALPLSPNSPTLTAAENALDAQDWMAAEANLKQLSAVGTTALDRQYLLYLQARSYYLQGQTEAALQALSSAASTSLHPLMDQKIWRLRLRIAAQTHHYLSAAKAGDQLLAIDPSDSEALTETWRNLLRSEAKALQQAVEIAPDGRWSAWLQLALLSQPGFSAEVRQQALLRWSQTYTEHPGQVLLDDPSQPKVAVRQLTLLLPLSGKLAPAGRAIRDGYLAAHFAGSADQTVLQVVDSNSFASASEAYTAAVASGSELVIGPLAKHRVIELQSLAQQPVPIIALNRGDETAAGDNRNAMVQLSLAPEDEVIRIAEMAFGQGGRQAMIVRPAGSRADKLESSLRQRWQAQGGMISAVASYGAIEDASAAIKTALALPQSEQRGRDLKQMLAENIEQSPRRRADIDTVFLLTRNAAQARSIKPLLAYHYAGNLPIYATSAVYGGTSDARDRDLDGIYFVDLPWLLDENTLSRDLLAAEQQPRLNALGADAWLIQQALPLRGGDFILGNTGLLSLQANGVIAREPTPATFDRGEIQALLID